MPTPEEIQATEASHRATQAERDVAAVEDMKRREAAGEPPVVHTDDPPPATEPEPSKEESQERVSPRLAALLKRERDFQARAAKTKADADRRQAQLDAREAAVKKQIEELSELQALAKDNPAEFAQRFGVTAESFAPPAPDQAMTRLQRDLAAIREKSEKETAALREELRQRDLKEEKARLEAEQRRQVQEFTEGVNGFIDSKPDDYELIRTFGQQQMVLTVIGEHYQKTGRTLTPKEAADLVEQHLMEEAEKAAATKKVSARFTPTQPQPHPTGNQPPTVQPAQPPKTLSNDLTTTSLSGDQSGDRYARAIAALRGQQP